MCVCVAVNLTTGKVCVNFLTPGEWSPSYTLHSSLMGILSLFEDPNTASGENAHAAELYDKDKSAYWERVYEMHERNMASFWREQQPRSSAATVAAAAPSASNTAAAAASTI